MSRTYRKRPIYDDKNLKFGTGFKWKDNDFVNTGTLIPAKRQINHFEAEVTEARVLKSEKRCHNHPCYIPKISEE